MRLWHKDLLSVLPRQQLIGQWRECCAIAKNISQNGTPNHILVNKIMDYPFGDFIQYACLVFCTMMDRGYRCEFARFSKLFTNIVELVRRDTTTELYPEWHNDRYLKQCLYNLQEKYDCHGISEDEWQAIVNKFGDMI